ncbi:hypothetical protein N752_29090 [Desulforamulus aquiferis]|nr:hypothetical protein [Desulforamulus aquiferis]RYD01635.1 hypothetical protein N752_29090 [Desulforamulus aquiferis]
MDAAEFASEIADQLSNSGEVEDFVGPFRPHLLPGDLAEIMDNDGPRLLGIITTVKHSWSKTTGFLTSITIDSGGKIGRPQLRELIDQLASKQSSAKRVYN